MLSCGGVDTKPGSGTDVNPSRSPTHGPSPESPLEPWGVSEPHGDPSQGGSVRPGAVSGRTEGGLLPRIGSLFSGAGMLDHAVQQVLGGTPAWYCEYEPPSKANPTPNQAAARLLARRYPGVPNHGDITHVDWSTIEPVQVLTGGFPCNDVSSAGKRAGMRPDTRSGLWSQMAYAISQLRPELVVIENVRGLLSADAHCDLEPCAWCVGDDEGRPLRALGRLLGDLADLGYDASWCGLRAADVGAPHGRFRVFVCAWPATDTDRGDLQRRGIGGVLDGSAGPGEGEGPQRERYRDTAGDGRSVTADPEGLRQVRPRTSQGRGAGSSDGSQLVPDTAGDGWREGRPEPAGQLRGSDVAVSGDGAAANPNGAGRWPGCGVGRGPGAAVERDGAPSSPDTAGQGWGRQQPHDVGEYGSETVREGQTEPGRRDSAPTDWGDYTTAITRWELILGRPAPPPTVTGKRGGQQLSPHFVEWLMGWPEGWVTAAVPRLSRNDQLKILGNGVVPQQAAAALSWLLRVPLECAA